MASSATSSSHKRTSSTAGNTQQPPETKRRAQDLPTISKPQYVYILVQHSAPAYGDSTSDILGVYATIKDANNALIRVVHEEYDHAEDCSRRVKSDGRISWSSRDVGEGDQAQLSVEVKEVRPAGSEPDREWEDDEEGDGEEEEEDEDEEGGGDEGEEDD